MDVAIGVDSHKRSAAAAAVDRLGSVVASREFPNTPKGHADCVQWVRTRGDQRQVGIECSGTYGAALAAVLLEAGEDVKEVPTPLAYRERRRKRSEGKSDPIDAVAIARIVMREENLSSPKRNQDLSDIKLLCDYRDQLKQARTRLTNRLHIDLVILRPEYSQTIPNLRAKMHLAAAKRLIRGDKSVRAELIRVRLAEVSRINTEVATLDKKILQRVRQTGTGLTDIPGVGPFIAAKILGEVGEIGRIRSKAAFAAMSGTAPIPASSGATNRHRLNRSGNRQLNWALHYIALAQHRVSPEAKVYLAKHREAGKSHKEAMRCLKRQLSNVVFRQLQKDVGSQKIGA